MADFQIARNIGSIFESATRTINKNLDTSNVVLPPSVTSFINTNYYKVDTNFTTEEITKALNSTNETEIYAVLKYLINQLTTKVMNQSHENELLQLFPFVVKNVNSSNYKIKRLVYILLLKYNYLKQDISLLSINAIQRSLMDKDCVNRSLAIRCLSGIKIPAILPILLLSLEKSIKDSSPLVRSASAIAIHKCINLECEYSNESNKREFIHTSLKDESSTISQLVSYLDILLSDNDSKVLSIALFVYSTDLNGFFDVFHNKIKNLANHLETLDSFAKNVFLDIMTDYSKCFFPGFENIADAPAEIALINEKLKLLKYSPDGNVILSLIRFLVNILPFETVNFNLERLMLKFINKQDNEEMQYLFLNQFEFLLTNKREIKIEIEDYQLNNFYILKKDNVNNFNSKVNILFKLINNDNFTLIFNELKQNLDYLSFDYQLIILKKLNMLILNYELETELLNLLIKFFMTKLESNEEYKNDELISEYITGLRQLIQTNLVEYIDILIKLIGRLFLNNLLSNAKSSIIWLIGELVINNKEESNEKINSVLKFIPNICELLTKNFKGEVFEVKIQILTFIGKVVIKDVYTKREEKYLEGIKENKLFKIWNYVLELSRLDLNLELRDQSRFLGSLIPNVIYNEREYNSKDWEISELIDLNHDEILSKCKGIDIGILMYQIDEKIKISGDKTNDRIYFDKNEIDKNILSFNNVASSSFNDEYLNYYNELRSLDFELKDYNKYASGISNSTFNFSSEISRDRKTKKRYENTVDFNESDEEKFRQNTFKSKKNSNNYKLQTLDDFLNS